MLPLSISYLIGDLGLTHLKTVKKYVPYIAFSRNFEKKGVYWDVNQGLERCVCILGGSGHSGWESDVVLVCGHKPCGPSQCSLESEFV